jgi:gp16 family phage-associated protein
MLANKPEPKKLKTRQEVLEEFIRKGISISAWARDHGVSRTLVHQILNGNNPCRFGQSHKIAVLLGIKDGEIVGEECNSSVGESVASSVAAKRAATVSANV